MIINKKKVVAILSVCAVLFLFLNQAAGRQDKKPVEQGGQVNQDLINLNFRQADILAVLEFYSRFFDKAFLPDDALKGKVTVISPRPLPKEEAKKLLFSILDMRGFSVVEDRDYFKVVKKKKAVQDGLQVKPEGSTGDQLFTEVIQLKYTDARSIIQDLKPLLSPESNLFTGKDLNYMVITDTAANINKVKRLVKDIDLPGSIPETRAYRLQYIKAETMAPVLTELFKASQKEKKGAKKILPVKETNSLLITASQVYHDRIQDLIKQLDKRTKQVSISAKIVEVALDDSSRLGFEWSIAARARKHRNKVGVALDAGHILTERDATVTDGVLILNEVLRGLPGEALKFGILRQDQFGALISFIASDSNTRVISTPHILAMDNQEAILRVGDEIPILKEYRLDSNQNPIRTFDQLKIGLELKITPSIAENRDVTMKIAHKLSNLSDYDPETYAYQISEREASTTVVVRDRYTLVIGGLMRDDLMTRDTGVPLLRRVPLLGWLFGRESSGSEKRELLIFLTPMVIDSPEEGQEVNRIEKAKHPLAVEEGGIEFDL